MRRRKIRKRFRKLWRAWVRRCELVIMGSALWKITVQSDAYLEPIELFDRGDIRNHHIEAIAVSREEYHRNVSDIEIVGRHSLRKPSFSYIPPSYVATIRGASVSGANSMTIASGRYLCIPERDHRLAIHPANFANYLTFARGRYYLRRLPRSDKRQRVPQALLITGRFSANYFHFVIEALQSLWLADEMLPGHRLPILIGTVSKTSKELLKLVAPNREIIAMTSDEWCSVETLYMSVIGTYAPDRIDETSKSGFDMTYLARIREAALASSKLQTQERGRDQPLNIVYLSRRRIKFHKYRDVSNSKEIEDYIMSIGGDVAFPETMSIYEQIKLFHHADIVIGAAGATLANLLFCKPGAVCLCLHLDRIVNPWYFSEFARQIGVRWVSVVGAACEGESSDDPHARFSVSIDLLRQAVERIVMQPQYSQ